MKFIWMLVLTSFYGLMACQTIPPADKKMNTVNLNASGEVARLFGEGIISTGLNERDLTISIDGNHVYYTIGNYNQKRRAIVQVSKMNGNWIDPKIINWSGTHLDIEPFLSPAGDELYFASTRPMDGDATRKDNNIWVSKAASHTWSEPVPLDTIINTRGDEFYPAVAANGNLYYTATYKAGIGKEDIYVSKWMNNKYTSPSVLDTNINSLTYEFNAYVSPDENIILFNSYGRADDTGGGDLYISTKNKNGMWQPARNAGPAINSSGLDYCPFIDFPRNKFYFTSNRGSIPEKNLTEVAQFRNEANKTLNGYDNIYQIDLSALKLK